jgi:hypothetical protein
VPAISSSTRPGARTWAIVTHGHSDHVRADNDAMLATAEAIAIMRHRLGERAGTSHQTRKRRGSPWTKVRMTVIGIRKSLIGWYSRRGYVAAGEIPTTNRASAGRCVPT